VPRYFFSSSVCVYRDMQPGEPEIRKRGRPGSPGQRIRLGEALLRAVAEAYERRYGSGAHRAVPELLRARRAWTGGREKAPAAMCRKIAENRRRRHDRGVGATVPPCDSYTYVSDMVDGIYALTHSELHGAVNIRLPQYVTVDEWHSRRPGGRKRIAIRHVDGPVVSTSRNFSNARIYSSLDGEGGPRSGLALTYPGSRPPGEGRQGRIPVTARMRARPS